MKYTTETAGMMCVCVCDKWFRHSSNVKFINLFYYIVYVYQYCITNVYGIG
jgi:hypothetical protein